jgi:hypothetical protein
MSTMLDGIFFCKELAFKYVEKASSLLANTSKGEICLQKCENGSNNVSLPPKVFKGETHLKIHGSSSIRVISHPFLPSTCPSQTLKRVFNLRRAFDEAQVQLSATWHPFK